MFLLLTFIILFKHGSHLMFETIVYEIVYEVLASEKAAHFLPGNTTTINN